MAKKHDWVSVQKLAHDTGVSTTTVYSYLKLKLLPIKYKKSDRGPVLIDKANLPESFICRYDENYVTPAQFCTRWKIPKDDWVLVKSENKSFIIKRPNQSHRAGFVEYIHEPTWVTIFIDLNLYSMDASHPITKKIAEDRLANYERLVAQEEQQKEQIDEEFTSILKIIKSDLSKALQVRVDELTGFEKVETALKTGEDGVFTLTEEVIEEESTEDQTFNVCLTPPKRVQVILEFPSFEERNEAIKNWIGMNLESSKSDEPLKLWISKK